jgi:hypothetical protein
VEVFTEPLHRNGLHKPVVPLLNGAGDIENTASSIVACWTVFTEVLPGNALIKPVIIILHIIIIIIIITLQPSVVPWPIFSVS